MSKIRTRKRGKTFSYIFEAGKAPNGKRKVVEKGGYPTKDAAYEAGVLAYADWKNGNIGVTSKNISLQDYFEKWLAVIKNDIRPATFLSYGYGTKRICAHIGDVALQELKPRDIDTMLRSMRDNGAPYATLCLDRTILHQALAYAVYPAEIIPYNASSSIKIPKTAKKKVIKRTVISAELLENLFNDHPFGSDYHVIFYLAYYTGLRIGEILGLTWDDIDFTCNKLSVNKQLEYVGGVGHTIAPPKTHTSNRDVLLDKNTVALLKNWQALQNLNEELSDDTYIYNYLDKERRLVKASKGIPVSKSFKRMRLVCTRDNGQFIAYSAVRKVLSGYGLNSHSFRHTHATLLIENNATAKDVAARLGHSNVDITQNLYTHDTEKMQKQTVEILERLADK